MRAADVEVVRRGLWLSRAHAPHVAEALAKLGGALGVALGARLVAYRRTTAREAIAACADPCALVRIGVVALEPCIFVEVDVALALSLVDRALGGSGEDVGLHRPNAAERAVLALLAARVVSVASGAEGRLRVLGVTADPHGLGVALGADDAPVHVFEVALAEGTARIFVPEGIVARAPRPGRVWMDAAAIARLDALGIRARLRVLGGSTSLTVREARGIEAGDVVLLDEATARPGVGGVAGRVALRLPRGRRPRIGCRLDGARLIVEDVDRTEEVPMQATAKGSGDAGPLLAEVPVEVVVEIGRLDVSARELAEIGAGDTLVLDRRPGDPVELRAGDRLLGKGELVDVEGKIGVHVLEVTR